MAAKSRPRAEASPQELVEVLLPFVNGKRWLCYGEAMDKSPLQRLIVISHSKLLKAIMDAFGNLSLPPNCAEQAFTLIIDEKFKQWNLGEQYKADWAETMSKRLRTLLRHVSQALVKEAT